MSALVTLTELAHRSAVAPSGEVGELRFTAVGNHRGCRQATTFARHRLAVFRSLDRIGPAGALTNFGARVLAGFGLPLPPRSGDLAALRSALGAGEPPEGRAYVTPWLNLTEPVAERRSVQLSLFPAAPRFRPPPRRSR